MTHAQLPDGGYTPHHVIDANLPSDDEKQKLRLLAAGAPVTITGARADPEAALASLLAALEALGLVVDQTDP